MNQQVNNVIKMTITLVPGQGVTVTGPLGDRGLCYSMLEQARDVVKDFDASSTATSPILTPPPGAINRLRDNGHA